MRPEQKTFWKSFFLSLAAIGLGFGLSWLLFMPKQEKPAASDAQQAAADTDTADDVNILFLHRTDRRGLPQSCHLVRISPAQGQLLVTNIPLSWKVQFGTRTGDLRQAYAYNGVGQFIESLQQLTGLKTDYYVDLTDASLIALADSFGPVDFDVHENIYHYSEQSGLLQFKLLYGRQRLDGSRCLGYLSYCGLQGQEKDTLRLQLIKAYIEHYFNRDEVERLADTFTGVADNIETDIASIDIPDLQAALREVLVTGSSTVTTPQIYCDENGDYQPDLHGSVLRDYFGVGLQKETPTVSSPD